MWQQRSPRDQLHMQESPLPLYAHVQVVGAGQTVTPSLQAATQIRLLPPP
jgi:hypothetical protein